MRRLGLALTLMLVVVAGNHAGPNEGGVLNVQGNVDGVDTGGDPCTGVPIPAYCYELMNAAQPDANGVEWFVVVASNEVLGTPLRFEAITFGVGDYDAGTCYIAFYGPCVPAGMNAQEIPSEGWPGPNTGTSVSWAPDCLQGGLGTVVPIYYFGLYTYGGGGAVQLADSYPGIPASFSSCDTPPFEDAVYAFGVFHCGDVGGQYGSEPFCCCSPTRKTTWGQIKGIYR